MLCNHIQITYTNHFNELLSSVQCILYRADPGLGGSIGESSASVARTSASVARTSASVARTSASAGGTSASVGGTSASTGWTVASAGQTFGFEWTCFSCNYNNIINN